MSLANAFKAFVPRHSTRVRAEYQYILAPDQLLVIFDLDRGGRSATNDMEGILDDIAAEEHGPLRGVRVIYRDSQREWARVLLTAEGRFAGFGSLGQVVTDEAEAVALLGQLSA